MINNKKISDTDIINCLRALSLDQITNANSGHPGIALGAAPIFYTLFKYHLNILPTDPFYFNRDRVIFSAGHASALIYATMLCAGYKNLTINDLKKFRKIGSKTSGHPEPHLLPGIDAPSGPLGQGIAMSVGIAIVEKKLASIFNTYSKLIDYYTYCFHGDGCLQEGISYEAICLAGKLKLNKLILLYDSNGVQLDGKTNTSMPLDVKKFFRSCNWNYIKVKNGENVKEINHAILLAKKSDKPTCIEIKTIIGYGSKKANSCSCHGTPFTWDEVSEIKRNLGYGYKKPFFIPDYINFYFKQVILERGEKNKRNFYSSIYVLEEKDIYYYKKLEKIMQNQYEFDLKWFDELKSKNINSTRAIMGEVVNSLVKNQEFTFVGSADVSNSTKIGTKNNISIIDSFIKGKRVEYGVREFAMAAINNGINSYLSIKSITSTFFAFSDYCKPAIRLAAISKIPSIFIFSHDSITVGEDGPTHQPIEQLNSLRLIPNHYVIRPCNLQECIVALQIAIYSKNTPTSIVTSRGEFIQYPTNDINQVYRGAYIIDDENKYDVTLWATGSEVATAFEVKKILKKNKINARIVSAPCMEIFKKQTEEYITEIKGNKPIVSIEFGTTNYWEGFAKLSIGINEFGVSGSGVDNIAKFKLTPKDIAKKIVSLLNLKNEKKRRK